MPTQRLCRFYWDAYNAGAGIVEETDELRTHMDGCAECSAAFDQAQETARDAWDIEPIDLQMPVPANWRIS